MPDPASSANENEEHNYASKGWIWVLMALILIVGLIAVVAIMMPFIFSPSYPNGYIDYMIATKVVGTEIVPMDSIPAYNRNFYQFDSPSVGSVGATSASLSFSGVTQGMQMLVTNNTLVPLTVTAGSTSITASAGTTLTTETSQGGNNWCIPGQNPITGSFSIVNTSSVIPPGATFFFVAPSNNNLNLVQSTPINILQSGVAGNVVPCV